MPLKWHRMEITQIGQANIIWGWIGIVTGITSGSIIGFWAFAGPLKPPKGHESYDSLPRRLTRLAHVAMFMLPLINIVYGEHLDGIAVSESLKILASNSMLVLMVGIPTALMLASYKIAFKYLNLIPVTAGFIGLGIMAYGQLLKLLH